jgi:hypothetical protein
MTQTAILLTISYLNAGMPEAVEQVVGTMSVPEVEESLGGLRDDDGAVGGGVAAGGHGPQCPVFS